MTVITVSQLTTYIKAILDESQPLNNVYIVGEISNFIHYFRSGHMYFTLKDEKSQVKAVMFSSNAERLKFKPQDGMRVICRGRVSVYDKDGTYQLYCDDIQPDGVGSLNLAFEQLKNKLDSEGLFDNSFKKAIPKYPKKIGVATSDMGAAIEDIKNIANRRYPICEIVIVPTIVQGEAASQDIVKSIEILDSIDDIDLIIVARGGGSLEDLWAFNTEAVARAVFNCNKPVISAVGHETDYTICDFVSDLRAPTPSAAAELALPDCSNISAFVCDVRNRITLSVNNKINHELQRLDHISNETVLASSEIFINRNLERIDEIKELLNSIISSKLEKQSYQLSACAGKLNALSPLKTLERGYCITKSNDKVVKSTKDLAIGDTINVMFTDGSISCEINEVKAYE